MSLFWFLLDLASVGVVVTTVATVFIESEGWHSVREALADLALLVLAASLVGRFVQGAASEIEVLGHIGLAGLCLVMVPANWLRWVLGKPDPQRRTLNVRKERGPC